MDPITIIGAISSIIELVNAGTKLTKLLFNVSSQLGSAGEEVRDLGIDISLLCAVLRQLQNTLSRAKGRRTSTGALETAQQVLDRCKDIFGRIEAVILGLNVSIASPSQANEATLDFSARIRWILKRQKLQTLKATLESCKITLTLMVNTLAYAEQISARRISNEKTEAEDAEEESLAQTLTTAQQHANDRLRDLELEDESGSQTPGTRREGLANVSSTTLSGPGLLSSYGDSLLYETPERIDTESRISSGSTSLPLKEQSRASVWLNTLVFDDAATRASSRKSSTLSTDTSPRYKQIEHFLWKWTDQGEHWESLQRTGTGLSGLDTGLSTGNRAPGPPPLNLVHNNLKDFENGSASSRVYSLPLSPGSKPNEEPQHGMLEAVGDVQKPLPPLPDPTPMDEKENLIDLNTEL